MRRDYGMMLLLLLLVGCGRREAPPGASAAPAPLPLALAAGPFFRNDRNQVLLAVQEGSRFRLSLWEWQGEGWRRLWQVHWGQRPVQLLLLRGGRVVVAAENRLTWLQPEPRHLRFEIQREVDLKASAQAIAAADLDGDGQEEILALLAPQAQEGSGPAQAELWEVPGREGTPPFRVPLRGEPWRAEPVESGPLSGKVGAGVRLPSFSPPRAHLCLYRPLASLEGRWELLWEGCPSPRPLRDFRFGSLVEPGGADLVTLEEDADAQRLCIYRWVESGFLPWWQSEAARQVRSLALGDANGDGLEEVLLVEQTGASRFKFLVYGVQEGRCLVRFVADVSGPLYLPGWGDVDGDGREEILYHNGIDLRLLETGF